MSTNKTEKVKLGALMIDRRIWVRERLDLDHVRCLVNDLVNGKKFPPLKVDRQTKIVVGGNHRYAAYKQFYGNGWENQEIEVIFLDLPSYEKDPDAWHRVALLDNNHLALKLGYADRNLIAGKFLQIHGKAKFHGHDEIANLLHFTPQGWNEFANIYLQSLSVGAETKTKKTQETIQEQEEKAGEGGLTINSGPENKNKVFPINSRTKHSPNDIYPVDAKKLESDAPRAQLLSKINALMNYLEGFPVDAVDGKIRKELERLSKFIRLILEDAV